MVPNISNNAASPHATASIASPSQLANTTCIDCSARKEIDNLTIMFNDRSTNVKWLRTEIEILRRRLGTERAERAADEEKHKQLVEELRAELKRKNSESPSDVTEKIQISKQITNIFANLSTEIETVKAENEELKEKVRKLELTQHDANCFKYYCFSEGASPINEAEIRKIIEEEIEEVNVEAIEVTEDTTRNEKAFKCLDEFDLEWSEYEVHALIDTMEEEISRKRKWSPDHYRHIPSEQFMRELEMKKQTETDDEKTRLRARLEEAGIPEDKILESLKNDRNYIPHLKKACETYSNPFIHLTTAFC